MNDLSYLDRLKTLGIPSMKYRRFRGDAIECFKMMHKLYDDHVNDMLTYRREIVKTERETRG